ncbi:hypothetical protein A3K42_01175 [candidate division WWE3 bacterium RBG_13_37_7]|uniref:Uncharacterized protein n=1 Tax=candidate division WWE3 bacterium RBG_13_37_7 TaxID=1802609 RepID=A0A1F4U1J0_UNCKA|nr:MAG: hypothetical protein A3K42_01175 [candidate division WWE3 bacterium RBG_13_37_7]
MRKFLPILAFVLLFSYAPFVYAADLKLEKIGALDLGGKMYSEWWYTGTSPTLSGTGDKDEEVKIKVGDKSYETDPDSSGKWSQAIQAAAGDYSVEISQEDQDTIKFTLHLGQGVPTDLGTAGESSSTVPVTGFNQMVALSMGLGVILLGVYFYISGSARNKVFDKKMLDEF